MTVGSLFSGIGGLDLGLERAGMEIRWQVENDPFCVRVLEKYWPKVKRYGDVREIDGNELERVDLICGGFPCQPVSLAGRRQGQADPRWLWPEFARIVRMVRPRFVLVENTPGLLSVNRGSAMGQVLGELATSGYDAEWQSIPAAAFGAPHIRERVFVVAYSRQQCGNRRTNLCSGDGDSDRQGSTDRAQEVGSIKCRDAVPTHAASTRRDAGKPGSGGQARYEARMPESKRHGCVFADFDLAGLAQRQEQIMLAELRAAQRSTPHVARDGRPTRRPGRSDSASKGKRSQASPEPFCWCADASHADGEPLVRAAIARGERHAWTVEPGVVRMVHGVPDHMDRIAALGNAVMPQVAEWIGYKIMAVARRESVPACDPALPLFQEGNT